MSVLAILGILALIMALAINLSVFVLPQAHHYVFGGRLSLEKARHSAIFSSVFILICLFVLIDKSFSDSSSLMLNIIYGVIGVVFALSAILNLFSKTLFEKILGSLVAATISVSFLI